MANANLPRHEAAQQNSDQDQLEIRKWWKVDIPPKGIDHQCPSGYIFPFHFKHPVTGEATTEHIQNSKVKGVESE